MEKSIPREIRKRLSQYQHETISPLHRAEYKADGWVSDRALKRSVVMRRVKSASMLFKLTSGLRSRSKFRG